ncbi:3-methyl-2-oxobutanoate hydroxymethyltransferase, related [Neospora caninum Liverpool]|nr:3-methyl-2-oxobutanoate hydroxymethyltransferase, related [Neospora caninum Liverpool]CBZ53203.1 3-methyl-2-oxobutanoate hydroxymethyltransferase, related [Neospora caninum Liverpool]|eukprot:XP_003883235.1 3-methyl-2-oxobutanoate hydroxymethyltransferase, related [Neospora caninum Liverpool]
MADLLQRKKRGQKISMVTSYDANVARILDSALIDMQLVGDSLANVVLGLASTAAVDLHTMILFAKHVKQACRRSVVVFDLPYGTYHTKEAAVESVIQVVKQTGITAVKLEGFYPEIVKALREHVSVICHLGVQPQTAQTMNSRGKDSRDALELLHHSLALEAAGCQMIVLEKVCAEVAEVITSKLKVPTIGIGSGPGCDGQVLVFHDLCGLSPSGPKLKFVKQYAQVHPQIQAAVSQFRKDVETSVFPGLGNCFFMKPTERTKFYAHIEEGLDAQLGGNRPSSTFPAAPSTPAGGERDRGSFAPSIVRGWVAAGLANPASSASKAVHGATDSPPASGDKAACTNVSPKSPAPPVLKRVCVRGGGAMGQLMAWKLAGVPGVEVVLATHRQELKEAVEKQGNQLLFQKLWDEGRSPPEHGDVEGRPVRVIVMGRENDKVEKLAEEPFDAVLICTKSEQTAEAGNFALANVRSPGIVASFQNGLEAPRVLRSIFSDASGPPSDALLRSAETSLRSTRIQSCWNSGRADTGNGETTGPSLLFAPTSYGALEQAPGLVRLTGEGEIRLGLSSPRPESTAVPSLAALLRCAGLNVTEIDPFDVQAVLWQKVTVSAYVNAVTALLRCNNGDVANPLLQPLRRRVVEEVVSVARARGIAVDLEATDHLVVDVIHRSARNLSSMLVDVQKRRPTEIDAINGEVVKQGREVGVPTPVTETLLNLVRFITEQQSRNSSPAG